LKGKKIKVGILISIALMLVVAGALGMKVRPKIEPDSILKARFGDVVWNHELHARMKDISNCTTCHHTDKMGTTEPQPCGDCHKLPDNADTIIVPEMFMDVEKVKYEGENGPPAMTALHGKCIGCHKAMSEGPEECRDCHTQKFAGAQGVVVWDHTVHSRKIDMDSHPGFEGNCVSCHHQDKNASNDGDYRACGTCHKPAIENEMVIASGIKDHEKFKHGECETCHTEFNPEDQNVSCTECHKGLELMSGADTATIRPSLEQAVHGKCNTCHNEEYDKVEKSMPVYCKDCHEPNPNIIEISNEATLVWDHTRHAEYQNETCDTCHHKDVESGPQLACRSCHGTGQYDNPSFEDALKQNCVDCHKEKKVGLDTLESMISSEFKTGLYKYEDETGSFWWDHRFHAISSSLSCQNCHHNTIQKDGKYVTAKRINHDWSSKDGHIQACDNCHGPTGPVEGSVAQDTKAPNRPEAYKKVCVDCHQKLNGGPQTWDDFFKIEPIEK
jgi:hypothetical protein